MLKEGAQQPSTTASVEAALQAERERRRSLGIYYTPPAAATLLSRWAIRSAADQVLEPSFGGCAMLAAAVQELRRLGCPDPSSQLFGYDVDPAAFAHLGNLGVTNNAAHFQKIDFLIAEPGSDRVASILANPPFVSHHRMSDEQRRVASEWRNKYFPSLHKISSLWAYFLLHSISFLRNGGRMAFVLPTAIVTADYARPLLAYLQTRFDTIRLFSLTERLFIQAGTDERTTILLADGCRSTSASNALGKLEVRSLTGLEELERTLNLADSSGSLCSQDWPEKAKALLSDLEQAGATNDFGKSCSVKIGEVVGDIKFLVRPLAEWNELGIKRQDLVPLLTRANQVPGLLVAPANVLSDLQMPFLLRPMGKKLAKGVQEYISSMSKDDIEANRTFSKRSPWYLCSYETDADGFIGSLSHGVPKIIGNNCSISCSNAYYKISAGSKKDLSSLLPAISLTTVYRLSAEVFGRVRGSGGMKLEPSDVQRLKIPSTLPKLDAKQRRELVSTLDALVRQGELEAAFQLADHAIYVKPGLCEVSKITTAREYLMRLTALRLNLPSK